MAHTPDPMRLWLIVVLTTAATACGAGQGSADDPSDIDPEAFDEPAAVPSAAGAESTPAPEPARAAVAAPPAPDAGIEPAPGGASQPADAGAQRASIAGTVLTSPAKLAKQVVVYLEDAPNAAEPSGGPVPPVAAATVSQRSMQFIPFMSVIPAGGKITFVNNDPFPHNIFSPDGERFDLGKMSQGGGRTRGFSRAGVYRILCNVHPSMLAYVVVTPSRYFARADKDGKFTIGDVPNGTYRVTAWAPSLEPVTESVTLNGGDVTARFELTKARKLGGK